MPSSIPRRTWPALWLVEVSPGDFVYFAPYVPHQELNIANETLDFVVVRSDKERIAVGLDMVPVEPPEQVKCW